MSTNATTPMISSTDLAPNGVMGKLLRYNSGNEAEHCRTSIDGLSGGVEDLEVLDSSDDPGLRVH